MSNTSIERLEEFIRSPLDNSLTRGEQMEMAQRLLAFEKVSTQPAGEVVAWGENIPPRQGINRKVDFRWLGVNVEPGTLLYAAPQPDKCHK